MTTKYPLSSEMAQFVQHSESFFPARILEQGIAAQRVAYHAMTGHFARVAPHAVSYLDESLAGVNIRRYQRQLSEQKQRLLFVHGGGFYLGSLDSHHSFCADLTNDTGLNIISIDYRLAPEAPYPCALDDLFNVYQALLLEGPSPILLLGDSAGANLIAALTLRCRDRSISAALAQILIYPALALPGTLPSHQQLADAPLLDSASIKFCVENYAGHFNDDRLKDKKSHQAVDSLANLPAASMAEIAPLSASSLADLPAALLLAAQYDPLIDDAQHYHQRLLEAGGSSTLRVIPGLVHGALHGIGSSAEADQLYRAICSHLNDLCNSTEHSV